MAHDCKRRCKHHLIIRKQGQPVIFKKQKVILKRYSTCTDREIVRKEGIPLAFNGQKQEYTRIGKKCNPQKYSPSHR